MIIFERVLAPAERTQVETQLATKADLGFALETGTGCAGTAGTVAMRALPGSRPVPGLGFSTETVNVPASAPVVVFLGFSDTYLGNVPLPVALDSIGMTGCKLYVSTDVSVQLAAVAGIASFNVTIPNVPAMVRSMFHLQSVVFDPAANGLGLTSSNELTATIGN